MHLILLLGGFWSSCVIRSLFTKFHTEQKYSCQKGENWDSVPFPTLFFFFFGIQDIKAGGPHGFWLVSVLVMKTFALQRPAYCHKRVCLSLLFFLVKMLWRCVTYYKHTEWEIGEISWKTNFVFYMVLCLSLKHPQHFLQMYLQRGQPFKRNISC